MNSLGNSVGVTMFTYFGRRPGMIRPSSALELIHFFILRVLAKYKGRSVNNAAHFTAVNLHIYVDKTKYYINPRC